LVGLMLSMERYVSKEPNSNVSYPVEAFLCPNSFALFTRCHGWYDNARIEK
jgi:hypothetical protein